MKTNKEERRIKPVSFNLNNRKDVELLKHIEKSGKGFGTYIKELIEKDINKSDMNSNDIVNAINNVAKILESKNIKLEQNEEDKKDNYENEKSLDSDDKESKNIISNILNMGEKNK